jgi:hypothetical protein
VTLSDSNMAECMLIGGLGETGDTSGGQTISDVNIRDDRSTSRGNTAWSVSRGKSDIGVG